MGKQKGSSSHFSKPTCVNNESSAYNKVERIVVDYKMRNNRGDLKPNWT